MQGPPYGGEEEESNLHSARDGMEKGPPLEASWTGGCAVCGGAFLAILARPDAGRAHRIQEEEKKMRRWLGTVLIMLTMGGLFGGCGDLAAIPMIWSWGGDEIVPLTREETLARLNALGFPNPVDENGRIVLAGADLHGADLRGAKLTQADLTQANLAVANLGRANLRGADLNQADLYGASLGGADLRRANLTKANLCGASLLGAHLREAKLTGATYNAETWWPNRFDPQAQGAVRVE